MLHTSQYSPIGSTSHLVAPGILIKSDWNSTSPSAKTPSFPFHIFLQLVGEDGKVRLPPWVIITPSILSSSSGRPNCLPRIMEPERGERRFKRSRASSVCWGRGKRWKNNPVWIIDIWSRNGVRERRDWRGGVGADGGVDKGSWDRNEVSNMSPWRNATGYVSGVVRKNLCEIFQYSEQMCNSNTAILDTESVSHLHANPTLRHSLMDSRP